jgi:hypothetical protein
VCSHPHRFDHPTLRGGISLRSRRSPRKCEGDEDEEKEEANRVSREREVSVRLCAVNVHSFLSPFACVIRLSGSAAKNGEAPK